MSMEFLSQNLSIMLFLLLNQLSIRIKGVLSTIQYDGEWKGEKLHFHRRKEAKKFISEKWEES